jgi:hypothetical protein
MHAMIQTLESRTLFSTTVTAATLTSDKGTITADAVELKADLLSLESADAIQVKSIAANFSGVPKSDQTTLKTLEKDQSKDHAQILKDINSLTTTAKSDASKSASLGTELLSKATVKRVDSLELAINRLDNVTVLPLASLQGQLAAATIPGDFSAVTAAFPTNSALDSAVTTAQATDTDDKSVITTGAAQFQAAVTQLATDLTSVQTAYGSFPNLISDYDGTITEIGGKHPGATLSIDLDVNAETPTGVLSGTVVDNSLGTSAALTGTVTLNGKATIKTRDSNGLVTFVLQRNGYTLTGTYSSPKTRGFASFSAPLLL